MSTPIREGVEVEGYLSEVRDGRKPGAYMFQGVGDLIEEVRLAEGLWEEFVGKSGRAGSVMPVGMKAVLVSGGWGGDGVGKNRLQFILGGGVCDGWGEAERNEVVVEWVDGVSVEGDEGAHVEVVSMEVKLGKYKKPMLYPGEEVLEEMWMERMGLHGVMR